LSSSIACEENATIPFPVVGIGASAGGFAALNSLLQAMPADPGMALVVVLHLPPNQHSVADRVLQRATAMPVVQVTHTTTVVPGYVYVIPPGRALLMRDGQLVLEEPVSGGGPPVAIDLFLRSLALAHREHAIGIVLSGMGSDGTAGLACIRDAGGTTLVQAPAEAEYDSMPRAAIDAGVAGFVMAAAAMPRKLVELRDGAHKPGHVAARADGAAGPDGAAPARMLPARMPHADPPTAPEGGRTSLFSFADIHLRKIAELATPSVLLDADGGIVHVAERATRFLRQAGGEPTRELAALVLPPLRLALRAALFQARSSGQRSSTGPVRFEHGGKVQVVDIVVLPFHDRYAAPRLMLAQFMETNDSPPVLPAAVPLHDSMLLLQLEQELRNTRMQLLATIEQAELSSDGMRTEGEEMHAQAGYLRSEITELESGREELYSRNLALALDNQALQRRAEEADRARDDLTNLVASSGAATIFLDRGMRILRFTPRIADFFNVRPGDVGRPLRHITNRLDRPQLADEAAAVFETLQPVEREVRAGDGRVYIVRVHPYRTTTDRIEGAVMTFFDITSWRSAENALRDSEASLRGLLDGLAGQVWESDGAHPEPAWIDAVHPDDREAALQAWQAALARSGMLDTRCRMRAGHGDWRRSRLRAAPLLDVDGSIRKWVAIGVDIGDDAH